MAGDKEKEAGEQGKGGGKGSFWVSVVALVFSIISVSFTFYWNSPIGDVTPIPPSGYAIIRGIDPTFEGEPRPGEGLGVGPYPSDHIALPLEWSNSSGSTILVKDPVLVFHVLKDGELTGEEHRFFLVGEFPEMSAAVLNNVNSKPYTFKNSLILEPHTVSQSISVFRIEGWDKEPNMCFRFVPGQNYRVDLEFMRLPEDPKLQAWWLLRRVGVERNRKVTLIDSLTIQTNADFISVYGQGESIGWDFWSLLPGSRSMRGGNPGRGTIEHRYKEVDPCK